ncbi:MAG TPA: LLM class flavin-dependent oxidoreductase [Acidimicrobiia bacterium]|jgi:alkanesulfonate monooxygenase SsuD/methylene tetrahydromethanopterin reductase-like flavin-dependent oxidoreductase (luciferase family)|nr:LLM class flavin-dependent oxidoreductase [Acidimicrobiia bacterium]
MEFGLVLTQFTAKWEHVVADAKLAETHGLDSIWLVDHLQGIADPAAPLHEAWTGLAYLAGVTERVRLGHLVNCVAFRNVGLLAKMAVTLDHASQGRLDLGLGAGWYEGEYRAFGYPYGDGGERRRVFEATVEALVELFDGGPVDFDRNGVKLDGAMLNPLPFQQPRPPLVVGAGRRRMLEAAGRLADVWNCPASLLDRLEEPQAIVQRAAGARTVRTTIQVPVAVGRDATEAQAARAVGASHLAWMGDLDAVGIVGDLDAAEACVRSYADRGVSGIVGVVPGSRQRPEFIAAFGQLAQRFSSPAPTSG